MRVIGIIAEDRALCEALRAALSDRDLVLVEATVEAALRRFLALEPDVVVIDDAPRLGGAAFERVRASAPGMPILVLTAHDDAQTQLRYSTMGARGCVPKPFSCEALRATLDAVCLPTEALPLSPGIAPEAHDSSPGELLRQHQAALRWMGRTAGHIQDTDRLCESLAESLIDVFDAVRCVVLLEREGAARVVAGHNVDATVRGSAHLSMSSGLMRWFALQPCLVEPATPDLDEAARRELRMLGACLAAPLMDGPRVCGCIALGNKASGTRYAAEERDLAASFARTASISIQNARLFGESASRHERLDALLGHISAGVVVVSADRTIRMMNRSAERILQVRAEELTGLSVQKLGSAFADVALRTLASGKPVLRHRLRDAAVQATLGATATPLGSDGVVMVFSKLPEEEVRQENLAYSPFWEYLASRVAQEIKNPMVAINTFAQLLPHKHDSAEFRDAFSEVVQSEVARINSVVETLFDFARRPRLVMQSVNLNDALGSALKTFEEELAKRQIELKTNLQTDIPAVELDPIYFSQALHNVVQNSIEAMPGGGTLSIATRATNGNCEVLVADTGKGLAEHDAESAFLPFFSTKEKGLGLGLTLAHRIMEQHHGELKLLDDNQGGTAIALRLPPTRKAHADHTSR